MMKKRSGVRDGMVVRSSEGEKLGKVISHDKNHFVLERGYFFPEDFVLTQDEILEVREREVGEVDELELGVAACRGVLEHPAGDLVADPARAGAADDDADPDCRHVDPFVEVVDVSS